MVVIREIKHTKVSKNSQWIIEKKFLYNNKSTYVIPYAAKMVFKIEFVVLRALYWKYRKNENSLI